MGLKYHKIFTHDHLNARELSEVYMSDSSNHGRLFIIFEVPKQKIDQQPYVDQLINEIATFFDTSHQDNPEILLEETLQKINQILPEMSSSLKIHNWLNTIDLSVGIMHNNSVFMAGIGNIHGLLIHSKQLTTIMDKNDNINPNKIFSDIISGELDDGDALIISTNSLFDYISKEKTKQLVDHYSPSAAAIKINELLETVPDFVTFNSIIIKKPGVNDREIAPADIKKSIDQEDEKISDIIAIDHNQSHTSTPRTKTVVDISGFKNVGVIKKTGSIFSLISLYFKTIASIFAFIGQKIKYSFLFLFSPNFRKRKEEKTIDSIKEITDKKYHWWQHLSTKKRIAIIGLFVIALVFLQSLVFLTQEKADENKNEDFNNTLIAIDAKYQEVDAKLIYNDEQAAENILLEIQDLIKSMVASSPEQQKQIDKLAETVFYKINDIRHINIVVSPLEKFDMTTYLTNTQDIVQKNGVFYIFGDNKLYKIQADTLEEIFNFAGGQVIQSMTDWPDKNKIVLSSLNASDEINYIIFDLEKKQITGDLKQNSNNTAVKDLVVYGNNLYVLDNQNKQIFKYPESGGGFAGGQPWLKEEIDTSQSSSLTIDGSVYMIENDGKIKNFLKGSLEKFEYKIPHPAIGNGAIIKTFRDSDYLYIIDPTNNRVIILDKQGNIKDQYTSQKFDNLKDLAIDPDEKAIYLLNNQHLYLLAIN
ncbi:MAG: hypothetical protein WCS88_04255 [Patescibacteria group bacterium]|jgi:hypothetical protein